MLYPITAPQLRAARALLNWTRERMSEETGLNVNTIRNIEKGFISPRDATNAAIQRVMDDAGVELTEGDGVKTRCDLITPFQGRDSIEHLFGDIAQTIRRNGGEIAIMISTPETLEWFFDSSNVANLDKFTELARTAHVKCLLTKLPQPSFIVPPFEFRLIKENIDRLPCFIYGDRYATIMHVESLPPQFVGFKIPRMARTCFSQFQHAWGYGQPVLIRELSQRQIRAHR